MRSTLHTLLLPLLLPVIWLFLPVDSRATHLVGADISYTHVTGSTYRVELTFYRDCLGSRPPAGVGIEFVSENCHRRFTDTLLRVAGTGVEISYPCPSVSTVCSDPASTVPGIQEYRYSKLVTLPDRCSDWVFSWSYCCRNCDITTLQTPQPCAVGSNPGMYVSATLNNLDYDYNNSPQFTNVPITFVCIGQDFIFNHGVVDQDGDSLVYQLVAPRSTSTTEIPYLPGYSASAPITSNPPLYMDPTTGDITMTPVQQEVSVLSVMISEYREGVLIGSVVRDMAIYVRPCTNNLPELSGIGGSPVRDTVICPGTALCFDIQSSDVDASQRLTLQWNQAIQGANFQVSTGSRPTATFCWTPGPGDARSVPYMFTVTVLDDACPMSAYQTFSYSITVREPQLEVLATDVTCRGGIDGSVHILNAISGYDIQWSTGQSGGSSLTGLSPGSYSVTLTDVLSGCAVSRGFSITEPSTGITVVTDAVVHATCYGEANGFASVSAAGGTGAYSYEWIMLPNTQQILSTTTQLSNAASGDYAVRVTDGNGCLQIQTVSILAPLPIMLTGSSSPATCGTSDGSAAVNVAGGTPGYLYDWGQGFSGNSTSPQLSAGSYPVSVVDANGCQAQGTVNVSNINIPIPSIIAIANVSCNGLNDGKAVVIPQGGLPPFTFTWNTVPVQHSDTVYGLSAGSYTASITDANGCQAFNTIVIESPPALDVTLQTTPPDCNGGQNGSLEILAVSGGTGTYSYSWNGVQGMHAVLDQLSAGIYTYTVTDANGCEFNGQAILEEPDALKLTLDHVLTPLCYGGNDGSAAVSVIGGSGAVSFRWDFNGATSSIVSGIPAGDYAVTATDNNGCISVLRITVPDPPQLTAQPGSDAILCEGDGFILNAVLEPGHSGAWSSTDPSVRFSDVHSPQATVAGLSQGDNRLLWTVTDPYGCTASAELSVADFTLVEATTGPDTAFCGEAALLLRANLPAGMTGSWNSMNGAVFSDPNDPAAIVNIINAGRDTLRWTLSAGQCEKSALLVVYSRECDFGLPTAYSPNSDGKNDSYEIKGLSEYPRNVLRVFNRWGNEVFSKKDFRNGDWTGQNGSGELLPDGTYFVIFESVANDFRANSYVELRR